MWGGGGDTKYAEMVRYPGYSMADPNIVAAPLKVPNGEASMFSVVQFLHSPQFSNPASIEAASTACAGEATSTLHDLPMDALVQCIQILAASYTPQSPQCASVPKLLWTSAARGYMPNPRMVLPCF